MITGASGCIGAWVDRGAVTRVVREHGIRRIIHLAAWQVPGQLDARELG